MTNKTPAILAQENFMAGYQSALREVNSSVVKIEEFKVNILNTPEWELAQAIIKLTNSHRRDGRC